MNRKANPERTRDEPLTPEEREAITLANALGIYVHFDGSQAYRCWNFYDRATGAGRGHWMPATHVFRIRGKDGTSTDRDFILRLASGMSLTEASSSKGKE